MPFHSLVNLGALSASDLILNAFFAFLGACLSVAMGLWVEISGAADRLRRRWRGSSSKRPGQPTPTAGSSDLRRSDTQAGRQVEKRFPKRAEKGTWIPRSLVALLLVIPPSLLATVLFVSGVFWLPSTLEALGFSADAALSLTGLGIIVSPFTFSWYVTGLAAWHPTRIHLALALPFPTIFLVSETLGLMLSWDWLSYGGGVIAGIALMGGVFLSPVVGRPEKKRA
jgi:hypothetical protein